MRGAPRILVTQFEKNGRNQGGGCSGENIQAATLIRTYLHWGPSSPGMRQRADERERCGTTLFKTHDPLPSFRLVLGRMGESSSMLEDLKKIPVIDPLATDQALYEMLGLIFRGNAKSLSEILRQVTHCTIDPFSAA
jgi:hypothetical protein